MPFLIRRSINPNELSVRRFNGRPLRSADLGPTPRVGNIMTAVLVTMLSLLITAGSVLYIHHINHVADAQRFEGLK